MSEAIEDLEHVLKTLQAYGVRAAKLGDWSFDFAPMPPKPQEYGPLDAKAIDERKRRELDELLFASSGG